MILSEGLQARFDRHTRLASAFRAAMQAIGLRLLCEESSSAATLTVTYYPDGLNDARFRKTMADHSVVIAGGLGPLSQKVFRVGHMGNVNRNDILATVAAIEASLTEQGHKFILGAGIAAANRTLAS
jgi:alanine-glyoxylate transaminase/serine-glyoxylate transaminase/serine-pyruvate transaminase